MKGYFIKKVAVGMTAIISALTIMPSVMPVYAQEGANVEITESVFPDETFRKYVSEKIDTDKNKMLSESEIHAVTVIDIATGNNCMYRSSKNLKGIELFTELTTLRCGGSSVASLDLSKNKELRYLKCNETPLTSLNLSQNTMLEELTCHSTKIETLDLSNNSALTKLWCYNTPLANLDVSNCEKLTFLNIENTKLTYLDVSQNSALKNLYTKGTPLYAISAGENQNLSLNLTTEMNITVPEESFDVKTYMPSLDVTKFQVETGAVLNGSTISGYEEGTPIVGKYQDGGVHITLTLHLTIGQETKKIEINEVNFSDYKFRKYVSEKCDSNKDGYLSEGEAAKVTEINASNTTNYAGIKNLKGIEFFTNLKKLNLKNQTGIEALDVSIFPELTHLDCEGTKISKLDLSKNVKLQWLYCQNTKIEALDVSKNTDLRQLSCQNTNIKALDVSKNTELTGLAVSDTGVTSLNVEKNVKLISISLENTGIEYLDVSKNPLITRIACKGSPVYGIVLAEDNEFSNAGKIASAAYEIKVSEGGFKLSDFFEKMDVSRVSAISGAQINNGIVSGYKQGTPVVCKFYSGNNKLGREVYVELTLHLTVTPVDVEVPITKINHIPKITAEDVSLKVGEKFDALARVQAKDVEDGDLTSEIKVQESNVDTKRAGKYAVTYKVSDKDGATGYKTIKVTVIKETSHSDNLGDTSEVDSDNKKTPKPSDSEHKKAPKTSDSAHSEVLLILMLISAFAIVVSFKKKEEKSKKLN